MADTSGEGDLCERCGHAHQEPVDPTTKLIHAVRRRTPRVQCRVPTDHGWECPCRSRFHAG